MSTFGPAYDPRIDGARVHRQMDRIRDLMRDGQWRSLPEIADVTGDPPASISAQLRHLRKPRFGGHTIDKRRRSENSGLYEYQLKGGNT